MPARVVVLVSGDGSNLQAILDAARDPSYGVTVVAVGADRDGIRALERAAAAGVPSFVVRLSDFPTREDFDAALADAVAVHSPDIVVLAGFMKLIFRLLTIYPQRVVNTHPSLLPAFPGVDAVGEALAYGVKIAGVTVHLVDSGVDTGPVIAQAAVPVEDDDDEKTLHERIKTAEHALLVETLGRMARNGYRVEGRKVVLT